MTYGPVSEDLRHALVRVMNDAEPERALSTAWRETRVRFFDGGAPVEAEPENLVATVEAYRGSVLRAAAALSREGSAEMRLKLAHRLTVLAKDGPLPTGDQLTQQHPVELVDAWRQAALAATIITERELPALRGESGEVRMVLGRDGAQLAVALLRLDAHYAHVEGWRTITDRLGHTDARTLATAAELARGWPQFDPRELAEGLVVDHLGYDDNRRRLGPPSPMNEIIRNVYAANDALRDTQPGVALLRSIAKGHEVLSRGLGKQAWAHGMLADAEGLIKREGAYRLIAAELANARSGARPDDFEAGSVARGHVLVSASTLPHVERATASELRSLAAALHETDKVMSATIAEGLTRGWFYETGELVGWYTRGVIKSPFQRWELMRASGHPELADELYRLAKLLRDERYALSPSPASAHDRVWFAAQIEGTTIAALSSSPDLPPGHPRAALRNVLAVHHDQVPPPVRIVRERELGPAYAALVEAGALRVVHKGAAVPAAVPITPAIRAAALADKVPANTALAGGVAAWVHTGLRWRGNLQVARLPGGGALSRPGLDTWEGRTGTTATTIIGGVRVTTPVQTAIEVAVHLPAPLAHRILVTLAHNGLDLKDAVTRMDGWSRMVGRPRARHVLEKAITAVEKQRKSAAAAAQVRPHTPGVPPTAQTTAER